MSQPTPTTVALHPILLPDGQGSLSLYIPDGNPECRARKNMLGATVTMPAEVWEAMFAHLWPRKPGRPSAN